MKFLTIAVLLSGLSAWSRAENSAPPTTAQTPAPTTSASSPEAPSKKAKAPERRSPVRIRSKTASKAKTLAPSLKVAPAASAKSKAPAPNAKTAPRSKAPVPSANAKPKGGRDGSPSGSTAVAAAPAPAPSFEDSLTGFGIALEESSSGLTVSGVFPRSPAEAIGILPGDVLLSLGGAGVPSRAEAAAAVRSLPPHGRLSAVVRRNLTVQSLQSKPAPAEPAFVRTPSDLLPQEKALQERRLSAALDKSEADLKSTAPMETTIPAGQSLWVRIPAGIPAEAKPGDIVVAEATTAVPSDPYLDFLALAPKSRFWASLQEPEGPSDARVLRLYFFKMKAEGGSHYPVSARVTDVSGDQRLLKVSPGGSVILAGRQALPSDARLKIEFLSPVTLTEPPDYYLAGPGLWLKSESGVLSVSQVVVGRAAERAGLKAGDQIKSIEGQKAAKLDFGAAIAALYGSRESSVKLEVVREETGKPATLKLERGVTFSDDKSVPLPRPYEGKSSGK